MQCIVCFVWVFRWLPVHVPALCLLLYPNGRYCMWQRHVQLIFFYYRWLTYGDLWTLPAFLISLETIIPFTWRDVNTTSKKERRRNKRPAVEIVRELYTAWGWSNISPDVPVNIKMHSASWQHMCSCLWARYRDRNMEVIHLHRPASHKDNMTLTCLYKKHYSKPLDKPTTHEIHNNAAVAVTIRLCATQPHWLMHRYAKKKKIWTIFTEFNWG